jgi:SAM-dependent methyltransferase
MNKKLFLWVDKVFRDTDRADIRRTKNIRLIPGYNNRRGGKAAYGEWAHVIGIFQTIIYQALQKKTGNSILDIGCGTGLLGIASEPFVSEGGKYTGIDVMTADVEFCKAHYPTENYEFIHLDVANPTYASGQSTSLIPWPIADASQDLVTALSVWTHLREEDAIFYFSEIARVLKKGGKAIITFFVLNEAYQQSLPLRSNAPGRFHSTNQQEWVFSVSAYESKNWFTTPFARNPEDVIGVTAAGMEILLKASGLKLVQEYPGNWKEIPGVFFQDVLVFEA